MAAAVKEKSSRLDIADLRHELGLMRSLAEAILNGLDPWRLSATLIEIRDGQFSGNEARHLANKALASDVPSAKTVMDVVGKIESMVKTYVDVEISMRRAMTRERVERLLDNLVGAVRRCVDEETLSLIQSEWRKLKGTPL